MKRRKTICLILFILLLDIMNANAQSFDLLDSNNNIISGDTIFLQGDSSSYLNIGVKVRNNSNVTKSTSLTKRIIYSDPGIISAFNWGTMMYDTAAYSALGIPVNSGTVDSSFYSNCHSSGYFGSARIMYVFFDENNPADSSWVIIQNDFIHTTGIEEKEMAEYSFYPNPGSGLFICSLTSVINANFEVSVYNASGDLIIREKYTSGNASFIVDLGNYPAGIYFLRISDLKNLYQGFKEIVKI